MSVRVDSDRQGEGIYSGNSLDSYVQNAERPPTLLTESDFAGRNFRFHNDILYLVSVVPTPRYHMLNSENTNHDISQDLRDARALIEQTGGDEQKRKYRKAAEIILLKALRHDPENIEAKMLLQGLRGMPVPEPPAAAPAGPTLFGNIGNHKKKKSRSGILFGVVFLLALGGGLFWIGQTHGMSPIAKTYVPPPAPAPTLVAEHPEVVPLPPVVPPIEPQPQAAPVVATPRVTVPPPRPAPESQARPSTAPPAPPAIGRLAVSSAVAADIYQGDKFIGSTPATVELPAGQQTLEYRHGALRTTMTHDIRSDETTSVSVTFQATVQINAKPWAQVFVDGNPRRALGQTPLSGVSVPIGGVLVFENPNFTSKTHRVTDSDTAIQVNLQ